MARNIDWDRFDLVVGHARAYFVTQYHAGTREMVYRYVASKMGDIPPLHVSAALKILREKGAIIYDKKVWWFLTDK
jgi:hypothetical protein